MNQFASNTLTLILFFILLFGYTKLIGPLPFSVNQITTTKSTTFDVIGEGKAQVKSDTATISAGVTAKGDTQSKVQDQINQVINAVSASVKNLGINPKDIQTQDYSINQSYDYSFGSQKPNGYIANTTLTIKVRDISKINQVIDAATAAGATNVNNLGFDTADKTSARVEARKKAIDDAKKKASDAASAAGFRLGNIVGYQESENGQPKPIPMMRAAGGGSTDTTTKVEPGSTEVNLIVTLSYEIR